MFSKVLRDLRENVCLYRREVAKLAGISECSVCSYEYGTRFPRTLKRVLALAAAMNSEPDETEHLCDAYKFEKNAHRLHIYFRKTNAKPKYNIETGEVNATIISEKRV